ncbi:UNVERIFIED_CONTAM: hypothetical protein K2H54_020481 [Gekko kuhli]
MTLATAQDETKALWSVSSQALFPMCPFWSMAALSLMQYNWQGGPTNLKSGFAGKTGNQAELQIEIISQYLTSHVP